MPHKVDIIVPVFKEEKTFEDFYRTVVNSVTSDWRLFMVYDLPDDPTLKVSNSIAQQDPRLIPIFNPERGVAGAIKTGFKHASSEAIMVTAADLLEDVKKIDEMVALLYSDDYAIVAPSRYMKGGKRYAGKFLNRTLSRIASLSLRFIVGLPIHDATNGSKLYRKSFIDSIKLESKKGWEIALEITVKAHLAKKKMVEIPVTQFERKAGKSKFKLLLWLPEYLKWYWLAVKIRLLNLSTNFYYKIFRNK